MPSPPRPRRFEILRPLGSGGQGRVLAVRDAARDDAVVALKETREAATTLRREFALLSRLRHPNLVAVYDWFEASPLATAVAGAPAAYTQELVEGVDLRRALRDADQATRDAVFEQVLRALAYLHALGVAHLDLKPDNVLVELSGQAPLARMLDFGIARSIGDAGDGSVRGSFSYVAPEVLAGGPFDQRADLYALGVMMVEVGRGGPPPPSLLRGQLDDAEARRRWLLDEGLTEAWVPLVTALCAQDPAARPRTAQAAARLWACERGAPVVLHTPTTAAAMVRAGAPVGRDALLARCRCAVAEGHPVVLIGAPGSGRRTVARAAARRAQIEGHAVEWWPHGPASARSLSAAVARLLGDAEVEVLFARTAGGSPRPGGGDAVPGRRDEAGRFAAWVQATAAELARGVLTRAASAAPGPRPVLVIEGLDALPRLPRAVVEALIDAAERGEGAPIAIIATADAYEGAAAAPLRPLDQAAVEAFITARFGGGAADARLCAALTAASGGHPLQLETLVALLVGRGALSLADDGWCWRGDAERIRLPGGPGEAVAQRVALLSPQERAVLGAVVWLRYPAVAAAVAAALALGEPPLAALLSLSAAGLLWRDPSGRFRPAHAAVAEPVRAWVPPGGAPAAHRRVLAAVERAPLAQAWHMGGAAGAAMALTRGRRAWEAGRAEAASEALDLALELAPDGAEALALRAEVANLLGPRELQVACLEALIAGLPPDDPEVLRAHSRLFWTLTRIGDAGRAEAVGRELIALARGRGERAILTEALVHLAIVITQRGELHESEALLREAASLVDASALGARARIANNLGNIYAYREEHAEALSAYGEAYRLKTEEGDPVGQRIAVGNMGLTCLHLGRLAEAQRHFAASHAAARETGHRRGEAWSLVGLSMLGLEAGAWRYARRRAQRALTIAQELGDQLVASDAETTLAECLVAQGERAAATERARSGLAKAEVAKNGYTAARARLLLAALGPDEAPAAVARVAAEIEGDERADARTRARAAGLLARASLRLGDLDAAGAAAERALSRDKGRGLDAPEVLAASVQTLRSLGDSRRWRALAGAALERIDALEARWPGRPEADGVDEESAVDGPSRASFAARPEVRALRALRQARLGARLGDGDPAAPRPGGSAMVAESLEAGAGRWIAPALTGGREGARAAMRRWLAERVAEQGAERGFIACGDGEVLGAVDLDGEAVPDPARKLPVAAVEGARATGGPWRAAGASGRGAMLGLPVRVGRGAAAVDAVVVLQNRFVSDAFSDLVAAPPDLTGLAVLLRVWGLERALAELATRAEQAEARHRDTLTRSTEELLSLRRELESTREQLGPAHAYDEIIFASGAMRRMLRQVDRVVATDLPVYVHGESGTGKELVARAVHYHGDRAHGPFVPQNVSAIPTTLFESELFGHERGAFTGAHRASEGLFRRASGGTLFLDEIGDLPLEQQAKLLRVLETGEVRPVGGHRSVDVDVRIITATHQDLKALVAEGRFREDLYYRLNVIRIDVPPLRDRPDDIPVLAGHFLKLRAADAPVQLDDGVMKALIAYEWPGNVRQLENEVTRAALLAEDGVIKLSDLSPDVAAARKRGRRDPAAARGGAGGGRADAVAQLGLDRGTLKERVDRLEAFALSEALRDTGGNKSQMARDLGLSRAGLNMKLKRLGLWEVGR